MQRIEAEAVVSVSDLKKSPSSVIASAKGAPVAVLNHNRVMAYLVPAETYEALVELLEDAELARIVKARAKETPLEVDIEQL